MRKLSPILSLMTLFAVVLFIQVPSSSAGGLLSTDMEIEIGRWVRDSMLDEYDTWESEPELALVQALGESLEPFAEDRPGLEYEYHLLDTDEVNAFAAPGGFIFVTKGLLEFIKDDPGMLAGVLAHEIGHVSRKHHRDSMEEAIWGILGLGILLEVFDVEENWVAIAGEVGLVLMQQGHSRDDEYDADRQGVLMTYRAGWDPDDCLLMFLRELEKEHGSDNELGDLGEILASHPPTDRRIIFAGEYHGELKLSEPFGPMPYPDIPGLRFAEQEQERKPDDEFDPHQRGRRLGHEDRDKKRKAPRPRAMGL